MATVGELVRRYREMRDLTQEQLAKKTGLNTSYISRVEQGFIKSPGIEALRRIADELHVDVGTIAGDPEEVTAEKLEAWLGKLLGPEDSRAVIALFRALEKK